MLYYYAAFIPDEGKVAVHFPDLPGISAFGDNFEQAFEVAVDALSGHLEAMASDGDTIPEPTPRETILARTRAYWQELELGAFPDGVLVQIVPAQDLSMENVRVSVSFRRYALEMIDRKAEAAGMTRSGFLVHAASQFKSDQAQ